MRCDVCLPRLLAASCAMMLLIGCSSERAAEPDVEAVAVEARDDDHAHEHGHDGDHAHRPGDDHDHGDRPGGDSADRKSVDTGEKSSPDASVPQKPAGEQKEHEKDASEEPSDTEATVTDAPKADKQPPQDEQSGDQAKKESGTPAANQHAADKKKADADKPAADQQKTADKPKADVATQKVVLGSPDLTSGIPGTGTIQIEEIKTWLDKPENHQVLDVELPLGLSAGAALIYIPEDNPMTRAKIELGRQLYFDPRLSADATVSCASCHDPAEGFTKHTQFGVGIGSQSGNRNSPVSYNRILSTEQFWDGRSASLEDQAQGPIANPIEMGSTHDSCVECVQGIEGYKLQFAKIFPKQGITIDTIAKAIAAFERAIVTGPAPYDYYEPLRAFEQLYAQDLEDLEALKEEDPDLFAQYQQLKSAADAHPMSESARRGRELFFSDRVGCTACHAGANFTDEKYHNLGVGMAAENPDLGRFEVTADVKDRGAFKTPTLRNVIYSAPYMHDGSQQTLEEVVEWYDKGGHPNPQLSDKIKKLNLNDQEKRDLVEFMNALTGEFPKIQTDRLPK